MTLLLDERYETGPDGAAITTANTTFTAEGGTSTDGSKVFLAGGHEGALCGRYTVGATSGTMWTRYDASTTKTRVFWRMYVRLVSVFPGNNRGIAYWRNASGTVRARVEVNNDGSFTIKNGTTVVATSTTTTATDTWCRLEWGLDSATGQTLRIFVGANVDGTTPDETLTGAFSSSDGIQMLVGWAGALANRSIDVDAVALDDAAWLGPVSAGGTPATVTPPPAVSTWSGAAQVAAAAAIAAAAALASFTGGAQVTAAATIAVPAAVVTFTGPTGVVAAPATVAPPPGIATWTAAPHTVAAGSATPATVTPPAATATYTGGAQVTTAATIHPPAGIATWRAAAPTIQAGTSITATVSPPAARVTWTGAAQVTAAATVDASAAVSSWTGEGTVVAAAATIAAPPGVASFTAEPPAISSLPRRDLTLTYTTAPDRWAATTSQDRWAATTAPDRWAYTSREPT